MRSLSGIGLKNAIEVLLPHIARAGRLACIIQDALANQPPVEVEAKGGDRFTTALTDADILVEGMLGSVILTEFADTAFYGEEYERDRVSRYFPSQSERCPWLITLDPINGTLYFKAGLPIFEIILTVCNSAGALVAAVIHVPRQGKTYIAIDPGFAWTAAHTADGAIEPWLPFRLPEPASDADLVLINQKTANLAERLHRAGFRTIDTNVAYDESATWRLRTAALLEGDAVGLVKADQQLIDSGAIGFVVKQAGGMENDPSYDLPGRRTRLQVVGATPDIYQRIVAAMGDDMVTG